MAEAPVLGSKPTLLIADDDLASRVTLAEELGDRFQIVAFAQDAEQAISLAQAHRPDLALIDAHMPLGGGIHATREISRRCPPTAICALSTDQLEHEVLDILLAGAETYMLKAADGAELERALFACLRAHSVGSRVAMRAGG